MVENGRSTEEEKWTLPLGQDALVQKYKTGTQVIKFFPFYGWFKGAVTSFDASVGWYKVLYEDGDGEELSQDQLESILLVDFDDDSDSTLTVAMDNDCSSRTSYKQKSTRKRKRCKSSTKSMYTLQPIIPNTTMNLWKIHGLSVPTDVVFATSLSEEFRNPRVHVAVADFFLFLHERQCIWERRGRGLIEPWSTHPILNEYFFCNVYRELDRGTAFFHSHILDVRETRKDWRSTDWMETVLWLSYCYRQVNRLETFLETGFPSIDDVNGFVEKLQRMKYDGKKYFTGAHQTGGLDRYCMNVRNVAGRQIERASKELVVAKCSKQCIETITKLPGIGSFLAWQIFCDLEESMCLQVDDTNSFCVLGPGAIAALRIIFGDHEVSTKSQLKLARSLVESQDAVYGALRLEFPQWNQRPLSLKEIEHGLCEYSKFKRLEANASTSQRKRNLRSNLDDDKACQLCGYNSHEGVLCDTCLNFDCSRCMPTLPDTVSWICHRCVSFAAQTE